MKNSTADVQLVKKLFRRLPDLLGSQGPGVREWQIVLSLLDKALKVTALFDWLIQIEASIEKQKQAAACL